VAFARAHRASVVRHAITARRTPLAGHTLIATSPSGDRIPPTFSALGVARGPEYGLAVALDLGQDAPVPIAALPARGGPARALATRSRDGPATARGQTSVRVGSRVGRGRISVRMDPHVARPLVTSGTRANGEPIPESSSPANGWLEAAALPATDHAGSERRRPRIHLLD
jgi:hypothetical protein